MATVRSPARFGGATAKRLAQKRRSIESEFEGLVRGMKKTAAAVTSGTVTLKRMRQMDHPYARRHGRARLPRIPIHKQSGDLQKSLRVMARHRRGAKVWRLQFTARHAPFVLAHGGTRYMLARGFWPAMRASYKRRLRIFMGNVKRG